MNINQYINFNILFNLLNIFKTNNIKNYDNIIYPVSVKFDDEYYYEEFLENNKFPIDLESGNLFKIDNNIPDLESGLYDKKNNKIYVLKKDIISDNNIDKLHMPVNYIKK